MVREPVILLPTEQDEQILIKQAKKPYKKLNKLEMAKESLRQLVINEKERAKSTERCTMKE